VHRTLESTGSGEMLANRAHPPPPRAHPLHTIASGYPCARFAHHLHIGCARSGGGREARKRFAKQPCAPPLQSVRTPFAHTHTLVRMDQ